MYVHITRGRRRNTDDSHVWFAGKPGLLDRLVLRWMSPRDDRALARQNMWQSLYICGVVIGLSILNGFAHLVAVNVVQAVLLALQWSQIIVRDTGKRRSLLTMAADWWLSTRPILAVNRSQALLALGAASNAVRGTELQRACDVLDRRPATQIDAYLADPQTQQWVAVLNDFPSNAEIEDQQIAEEIRGQLQDRASAVLKGTWPPVGELSAAPMPLDDFALGLWRQRAANAASGTNWTFPASGK